MADCLKKDIKHTKGKIKMKKFAMCSLALALAILTGCTPSAEQINKTATAIGYAAGLVANKTNIKDDARNAIVEVLGVVRSCVPAEGQTYTDAWTPVIKDEVANLVEAGKINQTAGAVVTAVATMAAQSIDYLFERYPDARKQESLAKAGVTGALDGFLTVFKPVDCDDCTPKARAAKEYDKEAYEYFQKNWK